MSRALLTELKPHLFLRDCCTDFPFLRFTRICPVRSLRKLELERCDGRRRHPHVGVWDGHQVLWLGDSGVAKSLLARLISTARRSLRAIVAVAIGPGMTAVLRYNVCFPLCGKRQIIDVGAPRFGSLVH